MGAAEIKTLYLGTRQRDARFVRLQKMVVVPGSAILNRRGRPVFLRGAFLGHKERVYRPACCSQWYK